jgi:hypothetical protein
VPFKANLIIFMAQVMVQVAFHDPTPASSAGNRLRVQVAPLGGFYEVHGLFHAPCREAIYFTDEDMPTVFTLTSVSLRRYRIGKRNKEPE